MLTWIESHAGWFIVAALLAAYKIYKTGIVQKLFSIPGEISKGNERLANLRKAERDAALEQCAKCTRDLEDSEQGRKSLQSQLDIREDISRQDRIAIRLLKRHLRAVGANVTEIEREIKVAAREMGLEEDE
jgi:hypothetical protein